MITTRIYLGKEKEKQRSELQATALGYDPENDEAPRVLASGRGKVAQQIINIAMENGIPLREDPILAAALSSININDEIPPELYAVVAEIFAYLFRIREKRASRNNHG
jgi:flagellar biosynthesis protein